MDRLIDILGREAALFESFLQLLERQQRALVDNDAEELGRITELQREKLSESTLLHRERESVIGAIKENNAIEGDLTVSRLVEIVDKSQAEVLTRLRDAILNVNERILNTRNQNAMLLNKSREYINRMMKMLSAVGDPTPEYTAGGAERNSGRNVAVDWRV